MPTPNDLAVLNCILNPLQPTSFTQKQDDKVAAEEGEELDNELLSSVKSMELNGVMKAEEGKLNEALNLFTQAIHLMPGRASGYNNRAQAFRLTGQNEEALSDVNKAVHLSKGKGKAGVNALCQRALLLFLKGRVEEANRDLQAAAAEGHEFAKCMLVRTNPYSALCNQMLNEMMRKLEALDV